VVEDVVWLFAYEDPADEPYANWVARAIWISKDLDSRWAPRRFGKPVSGNQELSLDYGNPEPIRSLLHERRTDKGTYLRALDAFIQRAPATIAEVRTLLGGSGPVEERVEVRLADIAEELLTLPRPNDQQVPPLELADVDEAFVAVDAQLSNVTLPYTELGRSRWAPAGRAKVARMSLGFLDEAWEKLQVERARLR
jgi:hypothetical protein